MSNASAPQAAKNGVHVWVSEWVREDLEGDLLLQTSVSVRVSVSRCVQRWLPMVEERVTGFE